MTLVPFNHSNGSGVNTTLTTQRLGTVTRTFVCLIYSYLAANFCTAWH